MFGRALLLTVVLLTTGLAGCIGGKDETPLEDSGNTTMLGTVLDNQTSSEDGRFVSAFNETNRTETSGIGAMMHQHDYWQGKERLDVGYIPGGLIPFPLFPCKRADGACTVGSAGDDTYPAATAIADFLMRPLDDNMKLIPEGASKLEFKMTHFTGPDLVGEPAPPAPANPQGKVFFDYLAANDEPGKFRKGGELKLNEPVTIDLAPTDADMPHQTKSLWIFRIYSNSEMLWFEFNISITAIQGYDVVNWPPHPDLYAERDTRTVFEGPVKLASKGTLDTNLYGSDAGWVHPERVISWGSDRVEIEVTDVAIASQVAPTGWVFEYNNASKPPLLGNGAQYSARLIDESSDGKSFHFVIDLTSDRGDAMDTPYAQYSRWGFRLVPQFDNGVKEACVDGNSPLGDYGRFIQQFLVGCQFVPWEATYKMKIVAFGHSIADGAPEAAP